MIHCLSMAICLSRLKAIASHRSWSTQLQFVWVAMGNPKIIQVFKQMVMFYWGKAMVSGILYFGGKHHRG